MSRKQIGIAVAVALALNVTIILLRTGSQSKFTAIQADIRARQAKREAVVLRSGAEVDKGRSFDLIGDLTSKFYWTQSLPLAQEQASAITKLNALVSEARCNSYLADADYVEGIPPVFLEYVNHSNARRDEVIPHAQYLSVGLLTGPQAAFLTQRLLSGRRAYGLFFEHVQELLGMTESQKEKLVQVNEDERKKPIPFHAFSVNINDPKQEAAGEAAPEQDFSSKVMGILTPSQLEIWSRLASERSLPAEPPDLPALSDADAARFKIEDISPTFRALVEKAAALGLSSDQKKLLQDLQDVMQHGLLWIGLRNHDGPTVSTDVGKEPADRVSQTRAEFVKHAEQVALLGILTQRQAEQLQAAIKKN